MDSDEDGNMAKRTRRQGRLLNEYEQVIESNIAERLEFGKELGLFISLWLFSFLRPLL